METVVIEAEVPDAVATALTRLAPGDKALLRCAVSATVVEFAQTTAGAEPLTDADSWDSFFKQSRALAVDELPAAFSANHDHYLHGAPKRDSAP